MNKHGWTYKRFDEVFDLQMGKTPDRKNLSFFGGDNVWVSIKDLNGKYIDDSKEHITDEAVATSGIKQVKEGTVIMSFKLTVGKCAIAQRDLYTNEAIMAFNIKNGYSFDASFLYYYLQGYHWSGANNAVMGLTLNKATISKHKVAIPSMEEQEAIVAELDEINEAIVALQQQVADLDTLAQSTFYTMFGDPYENKHNWPMFLFNEVCETVTDFVAAGSFASLRENVVYINNPDFAQLVRTVDLKSNFSKKAFVYVNEHAYNFLWRVNLNKECIILPNVGVNCGESYFLNPTLLPYKKNVLGPNAILARTEKYNHIYLNYFIQTAFFQDQIKKITNAVGQPKYNKTELKKLSVLVPPLALQQEFAAKVDAIESAKAEINAQIAEMQTLLASRMDYYFD